MQSLTRDQLTTLLKDQGIKPRLIKELRFAPETIENWEDLDVLAIPNRSASEGLLLVSIEALYLLPYHLTVGLKDKMTGRTKPAICDFCYTWQAGGHTARITFTRLSDKHTFTYICCSDLRCSLHVRNKTPEAVLSRTNLREDNDIDQRIARLKSNMAAVIRTLRAEPVTIT